RRAPATTCSTTTSTGDASSSSLRRRRPEGMGVAGTRVAARTTAAPKGRERGGRGPGARGRGLGGAGLTPLGLPRPFSAAAFVAEHDYGSSSFFLVRQLSGVAVGVVVFAVSAKIDAELLHKWAWPLMWLAIGTMAAVLVLPNSIAPTLHGSKRFLFGA